MQHPASQMQTEMRSLIVPTFTAIRKTKQKKKCELEIHDL